MACTDDLYLGKHQPHLDIGRCHSPNNASCTQGSCCTALRVNIKCTAVTTQHKLATISKPITGSAQFQGNWLLPCCAPRCPYHVKLHELNHAACDAQAQKCVQLQCAQQPCQACNRAGVG
jgi:hypothetical protein